MTEPTKEAGGLPEETRTALRRLVANHVEAVRVLLDGIPDPVARERAARYFTDELAPEIVQGGKSVRREAVRELRQGRTLAAVSELTGLSVPRVDQLAKGK